MIHPENRYKEIWDVWVLFVTVCAAVEIPLRLVMDYEIRGAILVFDVCVFSTFAVDIVLNFFTGYYVGTQLIMDRKAAARRYLSGWFVIDLLAAVPFDLFLFGPMSKLTDVARALRLMRMFRLARLAQFMKRLGEANIMNLSILRMIFLAFWVLMISHWLACAWIALGAGNIAGLEKGMGNIKEEDLALISPDRLYLRSLYWVTTTIVTIGYGDITPQTSSQTVVAICVELAGATMYGYVIGNMASLIANLDAARAQFEEKVEKINTFMRFRRIPEDLQERVRNYYSYLWESRKGYDEGEVLSDLPASLKIRVALQLNREIIERVPLFSGASDDMITQIVMNLRPVVYTPGDYVFRKGEVGHNMYFISKGAVEVVSEDGHTVYATLTQGNFFGEIALLMSTPRTATIRAIDYCDLYTLDKPTFHQILENYPEFTAKVEDMARKRQEEIGLRAVVEEEVLVRDKPPGKIRTPAATRSKTGNVELRWEAEPLSVVYQVVRLDPASDKWRIVNSFVEQQIFLDVSPHPGVMNAYRIRGANQEGPGAWSDIVSA